MMDFIMVPLIVGTVTLGIYKLFELFARRKERLILIEKIGDKIDPSFFSNSMPTIPTQIGGRFSFGTLKAGSLLVGVGLGLLVGFMITNIVFPNIKLIADHDSYEQVASIIFGSSVLLFGGLSLLIAFFIEMKYLNKKK